MKRACILCDSRLIGAADLELRTKSGGTPVSLKDARANAEKEAIALALTRTGNNISQAARVLGVSRPTLYNLFAKYELNPEESS